MQTFCTPSTYMLHVIIKILCWLVNKHGGSDRLVLITMINLTRNSSTLTPLELKYSCTCIGCTTNVLSLLWNVNTCLTDWCLSCVHLSWSVMLSCSCLPSHMDNLDLKPLMPLELYCANRPAVINVLPSLFDHL